MNLIYKNQNGFTLVELLVALVIFAVGILGVASMQLSSITGNSKANRVTEASSVAADQIEKILSLDYNHADLADGVGTNDGVAGLDDLSPADGSSTVGNYQLFWNIAVDHPLPNTKTIRIIVDPPGAVRNVEMNYIKMDLI